MTHSSTIEEINSTRRRIRISVPSNLVKEAFSAAINEVQQSAEVRGFRKGKVPTNLVRKFFDGDVRKKAYEKVVENSYQGAIKDAEFQIVSFPHIEPEGQFSETGEFVFTATVDINPKVEISGYKDLVLKSTEKDTLDIEEQVARTVAQLSKENGTFTKETAVRPVAKGDFANIDYTLSLAGKELSGRARKGARIELDGTNIADLEAGLVGITAGETKTFPVKFPTDYRDTELAGQTVEFKATLNTIEILHAPEINDEFAKRFGAESLEAFRRSVRESLANIAEKNKVAMFRDQIIKQVLEKNQFEVPESLIEGTVDRAVAEANGRLDKKAQLDPNNEEVRNKYRDWALTEVRGVLALGHIARSEALTVDDKEVSSEMASFAMQTGTNIQSLIKQHGSQIIEEFRGKVLIDKVIKHIIGLSKIEPA